MKKNLIAIWICIFVLALSACSNSTADNADPSVLYKQDNSIDLFVYNEIAYVNAAELDWVTELELRSKEKLGEIKRTGITKKFKDFDATVIEVGTEAYSVFERDDFVLVSIQNRMVPYYAYVEG